MVSPFIRRHPLLLFGIKEISCFWSEGTFAYILAGSISYAMISSLFESFCGALLSGRLVEVLFCETMVGGAIFFRGALEVNVLEMNEEYVSRLSSFY